MSRSRRQQQSVAQGGLPARRPGRSELRRALRQLTRELADKILALLDEHGFWDEPTGASGDDDASPRRVRRSADSLALMCDRLLSELRRHKQPTAISALADGLGLTPRDIAHPLAMLVEQNKVSRSGTRRGTRYVIALARKRAPAKKAVRKTAARSRKQR